MKKNYIILKKGWLLLLILISSFAFGQNNWDGSSSTDWNTPANWSLNRVPRSTDDAVIQDVARKPIISSTTVTAVCNNLTINRSASLTVAAGSLTVSGATLISGTITFNNTTGTEIFTGLVTVNNGGSWNNTASEDINFRRGITNNGTFNAGTGLNHLPIMLKL